jgi:AbrB family looped-hinge helix DNA binding protein
MQPLTRTITSKGQVTIPEEIRKIFKLAKDRKVKFIVEDGSIKLIPQKFSLEDNFGALKPINQPENFKKLKKTAWAEKLSKKFKN